MANAQQDSPMQRTVCIPGEGRVKLRYSCDACSIAKVKCDSQTPCERCRENAINCFYSPSRRHGKQPWAKRVADQHQRYLQSTMYSHNSQASASMGSFLAFQPNPGTGTFALPSAIPPGAPTSPMKNLSFVNSPVGSPSADHPFNVGSNFQFQNAWPGTSNVAPVATPSPASTSTLSMSDASMSPLEPAFQPPVHDCEAKALTMLHSLHMRSTEHPTSGSYASQQTPPLDKILHTNRVAVSTLGDLMQCHCAQQPHLALLYMATVSKVLFWYRLAINMSFKSSTQLPEARHETSSPHSHTTSYCMSPESNMTAAATNVVSNQATEVPRARMRANTIQIGSFDLEEEDEAILVRSVVTTEVKKAARLVSFMKNSGMQMNRAEEHGQDSLSTGSWYRAGGEKLEREVQDTLQEARRTGRIATNFEPHTGMDEQTWSA